jgi:hypothetical protein
MLEAVLASEHVSRARKIRILDALEMGIPDLKAIADRFSLLRSE